MCKEYKFWNKKTCYEVIVTSNNGEDELFSKRICKSCGEGIDSVYQSGKRIADLEAVDEDE